MTVLLFCSIVQFVAVCKIDPATSSETKYDDRFPASNVLTESLDMFTDKLANYWLTKDGIKGPVAHFVLDLKCMKDISVLRLKNTHNGSHRDRSTKKFRYQVKRQAYKLEVLLTDCSEQRQPAVPSRSCWRHHFQTADIRNPCPPFPSPSQKQQSDMCGLRYSSSGA